MNGYSSYASVVIGRVTDLDRPSACRSVHPFVGLAIPAVCVIDNVPGDGRVVSP